MIMKIPPTPSSADNEQPLNPDAALPESADTTEESARANLPGASLPSTIVPVALAPDETELPPSSTLTTGLTPDATQDELTTATAPVQAVERDPSLIERRKDVRNLAIIVAGWFLLLVLLPPGHEYPIIDDPVYAESVRTMLNTGRYIRPEWTQANLVGLTVWGAGWAKLFGFSFSTLTASTLALTLPGLLAFYGIARFVKVTAAGALLGTALLAFNPIFLHLSYSFMTDVPLVSLMLISCFCYLLGLRMERYGPILMWVGSLIALWAFYVRQFGVFVPVAFFLYLLLLGLFARKWRWWHIVGVVVPTGIVMLLWYLSERNIPPNAGAMHAAGLNSKFLFKEPWLRVFLLRSLVLLPVLALTTWAALKIRWRRLWLVPLAAVAVVWCMYNLELPGESWVLMNHGPFTYRLGDMAITFPQQTYTFGALGNIIRTDGIDFYQYEQQQLWSPEVWRGLWALGVVLGVLLLAKMADALIDWVIKLVKRDWNVALSPVVACYMVGAAVFIASIAFAADVFDRYIIGFLPFVILFVVRGAANWKRVAWAYSIATLIAIMVFSFMLNADSIDHDNARWKAGNWLHAHVYPNLVGGGWDWNGWVNAGQGSNTYIITDGEYPGMRTDRAFPYFSRLGGFTTRYVYAQSSPETPPLPVFLEDVATP
ncbi:MAG TPA: glycosyltransferase family 39 protein [Chloroflexia bacterium]|nr:glycosyltransferase family 39 protein [Chloroflexia bacterium]